MPNELQLNILPDLPQRATIEEISSRLWQNEKIVAIWLGGSLARGAGDVYSDVDLRIAVEPAQLAVWRAPHFEEIFISSPVVGQQFLTFSQQMFLHHLVLANGEIFDFFVQSSTAKPTSEPHLILGCRDEQFACILAAESQLTTHATHTVQPAEVRQLLVDFWINAHKQRKVLYRALDLLVTFGINVEKSLLLRLWYIDVSGIDCGDMRRQTIHSMTSMVRALQEIVGEQVITVIGEPMRNRQELYRAIERDREVAAQLGRHLAHTYGFAYPAELEATVLQGWQDFLVRG